MFMNFQKPKNQMQFEEISSFRVILAYSWMHLKEQQKKNNV